MKNNFYLQYNKINWQNQEKTKINYLINDFIIKNIILKEKLKEIKLFDIGFGIGFFMKMLVDTIPKRNIILEGCEPSLKSYSGLKQEQFNKENVKLKTFNKTFLDVRTDTKFNFITSIYVFPHFDSDELAETADKIHSMLSKNGKFILVLANQDFLEKQLKSKKDLIIKRDIIKFNNKNYGEVLHYSEIPNMGTVMDYDRDETFYIDLFNSRGFKLIQKKDLDDSGCICTIFVFSKI